MELRRNAETETSDVEFGKRLHLSSIECFINWSFLLTCNIAPLFVLVLVFEIGLSVANLEENGDILDVWRHKLQKFNFFTRAEVLVCFVINVSFQFKEAKIHAV